MEPITAETEKEYVQFVEQKFQEWSSDDQAMAFLKLLSHKEKLSVYDSWKVEPPRKSSSLMLFGDVRVIHEGYFFLKKKIT